jgi:hypothetical protein
VTDAASGEPASEATAGLIDRVYEAINARDVDALALISVPGFVPAQLDFFSLFRIDGGRIAAQAAFFDRPEAEEALRRT